MLLTKILGALLLSLSLAAGLTSCGGSSTSSAQASGETGAVSLLLTDAPADPSLFLSINASIESVSLIHSDNETSVSVYSGPIKIVDLLTLKHESLPFSYMDGIPSGEYCKIRLALNDLELVLADDTPNDSTDNETYHPELPGDGNLDLVIQGCFTVDDNTVTTIQVDLDAGNSIYIDEANGGYLFTPVIYVIVLDDTTQPKLLRLNGTVNEVDDVNNRFMLCDAIPVQLSDSPSCVEVQLGEDSAFFDNLAASGTPRPLSELLDPNNIGEKATVVGWPKHDYILQEPVYVPEGHYPPPGECKVWVIAEEAGQQGPPIKCEDVPDPLPAGTVLVTHDGVQNAPMGLMLVDALAVELGDFMQVSGDVATNADASGFTMELADGSPIITDQPLSVMLQSDGIDFNGTRIVSKTGVLLDTSAIVYPLPVQVDGTLELVGDPMLKAALVIVDTEQSASSEQVSGYVLSVGDGEFKLDPDPTAVCGIITDDLLVGLVEPVDILTVIITDTGSTIIPGGELAAEQQVGMTGTCDAGSYTTDNLVIIDDQRS
jgi:hypothetical protein